MDKRVKLPYLSVRTSKKDVATPPSSPDVGTVGRHTSPGKLPPLTKTMSEEDPTCNTVYVAAVGQTSSCSQDRCEETSEHHMQVKASRSDNITQSYNHYKIGYRKGDTNPREASTIVRLPQSGKTPSNQWEYTMLGKGVGELAKGLLVRDQ